MHDCVSKLQIQLANLLSTLPLCVCCYKPLFGFVFVVVLVGGKQESQLLLQGDPPIKESRGHATGKKGEEGDVEADEAKEQSNSIGSPRHEGRGPRHYDSRFKQEVKNDKRKFLLQVG